MDGAAEFTSSTELNGSGLTETPAGGVCPHGHASVSWLIAAFWNVRSSSSAPNEWHSSITSQRSLLRFAANAHEKIERDSAVALNLCSGTLLRSKYENVSKSLAAHPARALP